MNHLIETEVNSNDPAFLYLNLHPSEQILYIVRHHWAGFISTLVLVLGMALLPVLLLFAASLSLHSVLIQYQSIIALFLAGYYLFLFTFLFGAWINYYYDIIFITNERIINVSQEGLLARKTSELRISEVQDVSAEVSGFLRSLFNFGLLVVETAGEGTTADPNRRHIHGYFTVTDLPDPNRLARAILDLHQAK